MKLNIISVGHKAPSWIEAGCAEYIKRIPHGFTLSTTQIKPERRTNERSDKSIKQILSIEHSRIENALKKNSKSPHYLIALDETGTNLTTLALSKRMQYWMQNEDSVSLLIGSADGLDASLKQSANECIQLSSLTLPHHLARLLLCEQLYRAISILKNHPYHRGG